MDKNYLIEFNEDGTRKNIYAHNVHYQIIEPQPIKEIGEDGEENITGYTEEEIINIGSFNYQNILDNGGEWINTNDYIKLISNGEQKYIYKNGEIVEKPESELDVSVLKINKIAEIKAERDNREVQDIEYNDKLFDYDNKARERLQLARQSLEDNATESITWTCADNTQISLTVEDFKAINTLAAVRSTQLHEQYNKLKSHINSLSNVAEIKEVTFDMSL